MTESTGNAVITWTPNQGRDALNSLFEKYGLVFLEGIESSQQFLHELSKLGEVYHHHDSGSNGLTHLKADYGRTSLNDAASGNKLGLTQSALVPHTDRSGLEVPPRYLGFWIEKQSGVGGASTFVDGTEVFEYLSARNPDAIEALTRPRSVVFKSERGLIEDSIFSLHEGKFKVKFRFDRLVYLSPEVSEFIPQLSDAINKNLKTIRLSSGQGYLINNHRWLHGRTHYSGDRSAFRLLLN